MTRQRQTAGYWLAFAQPDGGVVRFWAYSKIEAERMRETLCTEGRYERKNSLILPCRELEPPSLFPQLPLAIKRLTA